MEQGKVALGRKGRLEGGNARAANLTASKRSSEEKKLRFPDPELNWLLFSAFIFRPGPYLSLVVLSDLGLPRKLP